MHNRLRSARLVAGPLLVVGLLVGACSDDDDTVADATTAALAATTTAPATTAPGSDAVATTDGASSTTPATSGPGSTGSGTTIMATPDPTPEEDQGRYFAILEVGFANGGWVTLNNFTGVPASLSGLYLCEPPACAALPDVEVASDATVRLAMGDGANLDDVVVANLGLTLAPASGEVGLYASDGTTTVDDIRTYLEWGSTPQEGTAIAIEAGLWLEGSYVESAPSATRVYRGEDALWRFE